LPRTPADGHHDAVKDEQRREPRIVAEFKVDYRAMGRFITDYSRNISPHGLFVQTSLPLAVGEQLRIRLTLPDGEAPFALDGVVKWVAERRKGQVPGMGVEFLDFDDATRRKVESLIRSAGG
jgi:uncharacterized protein (TIGR02266 family)